MNYSRVFHIHGNNIIVYADKKIFQKLFPSVVNAVGTALFLHKKNKNIVEIFFLTNKFIQEMNRDFRGKNTPTNVLSFEFPKPLSVLEKKHNKKVNHLGEIYLAPDYIKRKKEDIEFLAIHGVLHLLGYDHKKREERKIMEKKEQYIYSAIQAGI
jgi:rRNA maturation RNase YbeY